MDVKKFKIGIVGMGPVGMILAVHFKQAGCDVAICDSNKEKVNLIQKEGIKVTGVVEKSSFFDQVCTDVDEILQNGMDMLISCVKTYRVAELLEKLSLCEKDIYILSAQNGIDIGQKYTDCIDESKILRMVINFAGNQLEDNVVRMTFSDPPNYVASINDTCEDIAQWIAAILTFMGEETKAIDSFQLADEVWRKTILISAISALCGISKLKISEAMKSNDMIEVIEQTILESMEVARADGIKFEDNFVKLCLRSLKRAKDHFPSLGVDIMKGGKTEINYNNGKIVEYGRKHYIQTPLNLTFTNLVNAVSKKNDNCSN